MTQPLNSFEQERLNRANEWVMNRVDYLRTHPLEPDQVSDKTSHQDLVTVYDRAVESYLREQIRANFPGDAIVGEEYERTGNTQGLTWYIDPIDGTTNFITQGRDFAISVACWQGDIPVFGLIADVSADKLYQAARGQGAWCNGRQIHCRNRVKTLQEALFLTPGLVSSLFSPHPYQKALRQLLGKVRGTRCYGSVALELCAIASGAADLFICVRSCPWDHNAGRILVTEAGGVVARIDGEELPLTDTTQVIAAGSSELYTAARAALEAEKD